MSVNRLFVTPVLILVSFFVIGCTRDSPTGEPVHEQTSKVGIPVFADVTLDTLKTAMGSDFAVDKEQAPTVLLREAGAHRVIVAVSHDAGGRVQSLSAHVVGDQGSNDRIDELCAETMKTLAEAFGVSTEGNLEDYAEIGVTRTRLGFSFNFAMDPVFFSLHPNRPVEESWKLATFKPGQVKRDINLSPVVASSPVGLKPIPEASLDQLKELLDGFTVLTEIEGEQVLFIRKLDDHQQAVHCMTDQAGRITRIEAFVADLAEGANEDDLCMQLWRKLAYLAYKKNDPEKMIALLESPRPSYAMSDFLKVGHAVFCLPYLDGGKRTQLVIWERDPVKDP